MIIGIFTIILSIGFVLIIRQNNAWIKEIDFTNNQGLIILVISIIFLIKKLMEEITLIVRNNRSETIHSL